MGRRLPEVLAWRGALVAAPFVVWFLWRAWAVRTGRPMASMMLTSSVTSRPLLRTRSKPRLSSSGRMTCGVCTSYSLARSSVLITLSCLSTWAVWELVFYLLKLLGFEFGYWTS